jgi:hypothetical protein
MPVAEVIESTNVIAVDRPVGDARAVAGLQSQAEEAQLRERTREVLTTADAPCDDDTIELVVSHVRRANASYVDAFDSLVETGRMLNRIQQAVGGGGYKALFDSGILRIGEANASKLRQIAGAIDTGKIPGELVGAVPRNLRGAYLIASLPRSAVQATMQTLLSTGVLPDAPVRRLEAELKRLRAGDDKDDDLSELEASLKRKTLLRDRLNAEIAELQKALGHRAS